MFNSMEKNLMKKFVFFMMFFGLMIFVTESGSAQQRNFNTFRASTKIVDSSTLNKQMRSNLVSTSKVQQNACSRDLSRRQTNIEIINATNNSFTVNWVDQNCNEINGVSIAAGQKYTDTSYKGHVFRIREGGTNKILGVVIVDPANPSTTVAGSKSQGNPNACSRDLSRNQTNMEIINATNDSFTVHWVDQNCNETNGVSIAAGQRFTDTSYKGHVFRVREGGTNRLIWVVVVDPANPSTIVR